MKFWPLVFSLFTLASAGAQLSPERRELFSPGERIAPVDPQGELISQQESIPRGGESTQPAEQFPPVTLEKQRLLILPARQGEDPESIESRVTALVVSRAAALKRFEIIDRTQLERILKEQALQMSGVIDESDVVEFGQIAASPEGLIVSVLNFGQKGVPPESEEEEDAKDRKVARKAGLLGILAREVVAVAVDKALEEVERYPNNIQTSLRAEVQKVNIQTGHTSAAFPILVEYTGGNKAASLNRALQLASIQASFQLRQLYLLTSAVLDVGGREITLLLGTDMGVRPGTLFDIVRPGKKRFIQERDITLPGRTVGIVEVKELSSDANRGLILRNWERIEPGYRAVEHTGGIAGFSLQGLYNQAVSDMRLRLQLESNPLTRFGFQVNGGLGTVQDSRGRTDFTFGMGLGLSYKLIHTSPFSVALALALPLDLVIRPDDDKHTVTIPLFSPRIGLQTGIMLSPNRDLVFSLDYILATAAGRWQYTREEDGVPDTIVGDWDGDAPEILPQGLYFSLGLRFIALRTPGWSGSLENVPLSLLPFLP